MSDYMTEDEVVVLMRTSKTEEEWNQNCDIIKSMGHGTYPDFWYQVIILSHVLQEVRLQYGW